MTSIARPLVREVQRAVGRELDLGEAVGERERLVHQVALGAGGVIEPAEAQAQVLLVLVVGEQQRARLHDAAGVIDEVAPGPTQRAGGVIGLATTTSAAGWILGRGHTRGHDEGDDQERGTEAEERVHGPISITSRAKPAPGRPPPQLRGAWRG
jgi:hypothetical protein